MSHETESRAPSGRPALVEIEPEQEVDLGRYWSALVARWWLPVLAVVLGVAIGLLTSVGQGRPYEAKTVFYLGQPLFPNTPQPIQSVSTNFKLVDQILHSQGVVRRAAAKVGVPPATLDGAISLGAFTGAAPAREGSAARIVTLSVTGLSPRKGIQAADMLAKMVIDRISTYTNVKLSVYDARVARAQRELALVSGRISFAQQQQQKVLNDRSLNPTERLIVLANFNNVITFNQERQASLEQALLALRDQIALAQQVESARVLEPATAARTSGPSRRAAAFFGAIIGLILGVLAALLWDPVAARLKRRPRPAQ